MSTRRKKPPGNTETARATRSHDAAATKVRINEAAIRLLAEQGFTGFGVNSLAAAAGVDKQLIYYHFGSLKGVIQQLGSQLGLWLGTPLQICPGEPYAQAAFRLLTEYATALRGNVLVQRLLAWELVEHSPELVELECTRSLAMMAWVADLRRNAGPVPAGVDAPAINAILLAGLHYLVLRQQTTGTFAGMDIASPAGLERIDEALRLITSRVYTPNSSASGEQAP